MRWPGLVCVAIQLACRSPAMPESAQADLADLADTGVSLRELAELPPAFPAGWFDMDDGRVLRLSPSQDHFAFVDGREVKRRFLHEPFALADAGLRWTASAGEFMACDAESASLVTEEIDLAPLEGGGWRLATHVVSAAPCTKPKPEVVVTALHTEHVLSPIIDPTRTRSLEATLAQASAPDACTKLARCCRSARRRHVPGFALEMCTRLPVFPVECHDMRAQLAEVVDAGACR